MKKNILIILTLFMATHSPAFAQSEDETDLESYVFVDKDGHEISNGSVVSCSNANEDITGTVSVPSGIYVKNAKGTQLQPIRICYDIEQMSNGAMQICFPLNCTSTTKTGVGYTTSGSMPAGAVKDIQTEWLPETYGTCKTTVQIQIMDGSDIALYGPKISLQFSYADPTAINALHVSPSQEQHYNLAGYSIPATQKGLHLIRKANGQVCKIIVR